MRLVKREKQTRDMSELRWVLIWSAVIVAISAVPYIVGYAEAPPEATFIGYTYNSADVMVYLSWTRQAADGDFFIRNLFTSDKQPAANFHLLFLLMGNVVRATGLSQAAVYHLFRALLTVGLFFSVMRFTKLFVEARWAVRFAVPFVGLSSGLGWLFRYRPEAGLTKPVDLWQPEAITFLCVYLAPLFLAGLILMYESMRALVLAERENSPRHAVVAGLLILLLGNVHTYDVLTVVALWTAYLVAVAVVERRIPWPTVKLSAVAGLIGLPSVAYQFYVYSIDPIFARRALDPARSEPVYFYFIGYGLILIGAVAAMVMMCSRRDDSSTSYWKGATRKNLLLLVWSTVGFFIAYLPVSQQRKLIMGVHLPLCILCIQFLVWLLRNRTPGFRAVALALLVIATFPSNVRFLLSDVAAVRGGRVHAGYPAYIPDKIRSAYSWIAANTRRKDIIIANAAVSLFTPPFAGRAVYAGHMSETPDFYRRGDEIEAFARPETSDTQRLALLLRSRASYYVSLGEAGGLPADFRRKHLRLVYQNDNVEVYRIVLPPSDAPDGGNGQ